MADPLRAIPDAFLGLAPTRGTVCPRCGSPTRAMANGRSRMDICGQCGTLEVTDPAGLTLFSMHGLEVPKAVIRGEKAPQH